MSLLEEPRRWPAWYALFTAWTRPSETTRRTAHVSLVRAFGVHLLAVMLALALAALTDDTLPKGLRNKPFCDRAYVILQHAVGRLTGWGWASGADTAWALASIEGVTIGIALLVMPFGARLERKRDSLKHALRRTWLHTGAAVPLVFATIVVDALLRPVAREWEHGAQVACEEQFPMPFFAAEATPSTAAQAPTPEQAQANQEQWNCRREHPLAFRADCLRAIPAVAGFLLAVYGLVTYFRGLAAPRLTCEPQEPPICRACGYILTGLGLGGRCAECGLPLSSSLGNRADPGAPWERRTSLGLGHALYTSLRQGLVYPRALGSKLRLVPTRPAYLVLLGLQAFAMGLSVIPIVLCAIPFEVRVGQFLGIIAGLGSVWAAVGIILMSLAASFAGLIQSKYARRNVMGGAAQLAVYMGGHLVLGAWFCSLVMALEVQFYKQLTALAANWGLLQWMTAYFYLAWLGLVLLTAVTYIIRVTRAASVVRYARR